MNWNRLLDRLVVLEEPRAGTLGAGRMRGQLDGLQSVVGEIASEKILYLGSANRTEISEARIAQSLDNHPRFHRIAVIAFNDDAALGAMAAARTRGREQDIVVVGQGLDRQPGVELRRASSRFIGSTAYMPEKYGEHLVRLAESILRGEPLVDCSISFLR